MQLIFWTVAAPFVWGGDEIYLAFAAVAVTLPSHAECIAKVLAWPIVLAFGVGVGATELIGRYRDAPFDVLRTGSAWWYICVNALAALIAYALILLFDQKFGLEGTQAVVVQAMVAGFGAMVFFRSSLFTMKVGETDVAVGPAIFFQVLLFATDRTCDRHRAEPRSELVTSIMQGVSFPLAKDALPNFCFELMQNVPAGEVERFRQTVDGLASRANMDNRAKALNLGLMLMNVVGHQVLSAAVQVLGGRIQGSAKLEIDIVARLLAADFNKAYPLLVDVCFIISRYGTPEAKRKAKDNILAQLAPVAGRPDLNNASKMKLLGLKLQQAVGDGVLQTALENTADDINLPTPPPDADAGDAPDAAPQAPDAPPPED